MNFCILVLAGGRAAQRELIARAFAGDDVVADFEAVKAAEAAAEAPANDAPSLLPGWGAWTAQQRTPAWIEAAQAKAQRCVGPFFYPSPPCQ